MSILKHLLPGQADRPERGNTRRHREAQPEGGGGGARGLRARLLRAVPARAVGPAAEAAVESARQGDVPLLCVRGARLPMLHVLQHLPLDAGGGR